ncbi:uncharacterized protein LOC122809153 isoform X2 [Protopterus annectens]|uniref:uncharacterized protein LOC122809153 isoform X2 n=1 Tax=Protopterus annectens TaxID=7888 RepID=UPI001CFB8FF6|nr:uncharacterized protein LOC122809153 isoform X2 [Protopterus annectens]
MQDKECLQVHKQVRRPQRRGFRLRVYKLTLLFILLHVAGIKAHVVPPAKHQLYLQEYIGRLTFSICKREAVDVAIYHEVNGILCYWDSAEMRPLCVEGYNLFEDEYSRNIILYIVKASNANNGVYMCETTDSDVMEYLHDRDSISVWDFPYEMKFECNIYEGTLEISHTTNGQLCSWTKQLPVVCSGKYNLTDDYRQNRIIFTINAASSEDDGNYTCEFRGTRRVVQVYNHDNSFAKYEGLSSNEVTGEVSFPCQRRNKHITIFNQSSDPICHWKHGQEQAVCLEHYSLAEQGENKHILLNILNATEEDDGFYFCEYQANGVKILEYMHNRPVTRITTEEPASSPEVDKLVPDVRAVPLHSFASSGMESSYAGELLASLKELYASGAPKQVNESSSVERIGRVIFECKKGHEDLAIYNDDIGTLCYWDATEQQYTCMERYSLKEDEITQNVVMYILKASDADNGLYMCESAESPRYLIEYQHTRDSIPIVDLPYKMKFECNIFQGYLIISHHTKGDLCHWNKANTTICSDKYMLSVDYNISHVVFTITQASAEDNGIYTCEFEGFRKDVKVYNHNSNILIYEGLPASDITGKVHFGCQRRNSKIIIVNEYNQVLCTWAAGAQSAVCLEDYRLIEEANSANIILLMLNATEEDDGLYACIYRVSGNRTQKYQHNCSNTDGSAEETGSPVTSSDELTGSYTTVSPKQRDVNLNQGSIKGVIIGVGIVTCIFIIIIVISFIMWRICRKRAQVKKTAESIPMKEDTQGQKEKESEDPTERTPMKTTSAI